MISQGASEINLTFVIEEDGGARRVRRLHKTFFSDWIRKFSRHEFANTGPGQNRSARGGHRPRTRATSSSLMRRRTIATASASRQRICKRIDAVIDFTTPHAAIATTFRPALEAQTNMVVGTTGWYQHMDKVRELVTERKAALLYGSNFSIGMNFFFKAVQAMAPILKTSYHANIVERHHIHKKDKPSGTAVTLQKILESGTGTQVEVTSVREGETVGMHLVMFDSANDTILFTHDAKNRLGFAEGAVRAAEWIQGKTGFYEFPEIVDQL